MLVVAVIDETRLIVIHYTEGNDLGGKASQSSIRLGASSGSVGVVKEEIIDIDLAKANYQKLEYKDGGVVLYIGMDAVDRARERLGENKYDVFFNNCESFVNWAITGKNKTKQGEDGLVAGALLTVGVIGAAAAAAVYGLYNVLKKTDNK